MHLPKLLQEGNSSFLPEFGKTEYPDLLRQSSPDRQKLEAGAFRGTTHSESILLQMNRKPHPFKKVSFDLLLKILPPPTPDAHDQI